MEDLLSIREASTLLGLTRQSVFYQIKNNTDNIKEHLVCKERKSKNSGKTLKQYFIKATFILEKKKRDDLPSEELQNEIINAYYEVYELMEKYLEEKGRAKSTDNDMFANMSAIDLDIIMYMRSSVHFTFPQDKKNIEVYIKRMTFPSARIGKLILNALEEIKRIYNDDEEI